MDPKPNSAFAHFGDERVARHTQIPQRQEERIHVPTMAIARQWQAIRIDMRRQPCRVTLRQCRAALIECLQRAQLPKADGRGHIGQIELAASRFDVNVAGRVFDDAVETLPLQWNGQAGIGVRQGPTFHRRHVLVGMEAKTGDVTETTDEASLVTCANRMRCIFHHAQSPSGGEIQNPIHINGKAGEMNGHQDLGAGCDRGFHRCRCRVA